MKNSKYEWDGKDLTVKNSTNSMKLVAKGEWFRLYVKQTKFGWVQAFSVDGNGAKNFEDRAYFDMVANFLEAAKQLAEEEEKKKNHKGVTSKGVDK